MLTHLFGSHRDATGRARLPVAHNTMEARTPNMPAVHDAPVGCPVDLVAANDWRLVERGAMPRASDQATE
jgi:hypothetical protein